MRPILLAACLCVAAAAADDLAAKIRTQEKTFAKSVAWIKLVAAAEEEGGEDSIGICSGPVVTQGGRAVVLVSDAGDRQLKSIKILKDDGGEQDAEVLAHDADLGLMFVVAKDVKDPKAAGLVPLDMSKMAKEPQLGDELILIDRRIHTAPDENVGRSVRVCCALVSPEHAWLFTGIAPHFMGGLVVTPAGEVVGVVATLKDRNPDGEEITLPAVLPLSKILASVQAVQPKEEAKDSTDPKAPKKEEKP